MVVLYASIQFFSPWKNGCILAYKNRFVCESSPLLLSFGQQTMSSQLFPICLGGVVVDQGQKKSWATFTLTVNQCQCVLFMWNGNLGTNEMIWMDKTMDQHTTKRDQISWKLNKMDQS